MIPAFAPALMFGVAEGAVLPVVALTARDLGGSIALASFIVALIAIGSLLSNIPSSYITVRYGERTALIAAGFVTSCALLAAMIAPSNLVLGLTMLVVGSSDAVFSLARQSYLTEMVPIRMRARALSTLGGSARIGTFIGPFLGAGAIHLFGLHAAYAVGAAAAVVAGLIGVFSRDLTAFSTHSGGVHTPVPLPSMLRSYHRVFLTLGVGVILVSTVRASRQVVIPLWAEHLGMSASATSVLYGIAGALDMATFYPAGKVMDRKGRRWVAVPSMVLMGLALLTVPFTHGYLSLMMVSMVLGFGNGIGAGMVMTMGADHAPAIGRPVFLGVWRQLSDIGYCGGPVLLSAVTSTAGLAAGISVTGGIGLLAAGVLWYWVPRAGRTKRR
jgi:MFS family permease